MAIFSNAQRWPQFLVNFEFVTSQPSEHTIQLLNDVLQAANISLQKYHQMTTKSFKKIIKKYFEFHDQFINFMCRFMDQMHTFAQRFHHFEGYHYPDIEQIILPFLRDLLMQYFGDRGILNNKSRYPRQANYYLQTLFSAVAFASVFEPYQGQEIVFKERYLQREWCTNLHKLFAITREIIQRTILQIVIPSPHAQPLQHLMLYVSQLSFVVNQSVHPLNPDQKVQQSYYLFRRNKEEYQVHLVVDCVTNNNSNKLKSRAKRCKNKRIKTISPSPNLNLNESCQQSKNQQRSSRFCTQNDEQAQARIFNVANRHRGTNQINRRHTMNEQHPHQCPQEIMKQLQIMQTLIRNNKNDVIAKIDRVNEYHQANCNKTLSLLKHLDQSVQEKIQYERERAKKQKQNDIEQMQEFRNLINELKQRQNQINSLQRVIHRMQQQSSNHNNHNNHNNQYDDDSDQSSSDDSEHDNECDWEDLVQWIINQYENDKSPNMEDFRQHRQQRIQTRSSTFSNSNNNGYSSIPQEQEQHEQFEEVLTAENDCDSSNGGDDESNSSSDEDDKTKDPDYVPHVDDTYNEATITMGPQKRRKY